MKGEQMECPYGCLWRRLTVAVRRRRQTQLPPDYIDLEKRVDALKAVHQKMLAVT